MMQALRFSEEHGLRLEAVPLPIPAAGEALIRISRAGVCSTDLEIMRGYVPGFDHTMGHEFVGVVLSSESDRSWEGERVVGEINCRCGAPFSHPDPVFERNHAPERTVLGIIGKDGAMAQYCTLPVGNLHRVPHELSDLEACFAEPLAAACRIVEQKVRRVGGNRRSRCLQMVSSAVIFSRRPPPPPPPSRPQVIRSGDAVAVIGDGKLGLLIAQVLVAEHDAAVTHLGRHQRKLGLVEGTTAVVVGDGTAVELAQRFDVVVEASGSSQGITLAMALSRPLGTLVLKSTCSAAGGAAAQAWAPVCSDVVVNEKRLVGSRCGPFQPALQLLRGDARVRRLVNAMVDEAVPLAEGVAAVAAAQRRGALKVQLVMEAPAPAPV
jgi:threonine dehydrogenase-like Zn-dependent dehydrogenase